MSLATRIESLVIRVAQEFNDVRAKAGNLANLTTTDKSNLVAAINELKAAVVSSAVIDIGVSCCKGSWRKPGCRPCSASAVTAMSCCRPWICG